MKTTPPIGTKVVLTNESCDPGASGIVSDHANEPGVVKITTATAQIWLHRDALVVDHEYKAQNTSYTIAD